MTMVDLHCHGLTPGMAVIVTPGAGTDKRRAKDSRQVRGVVYAVNDRIFTLNTSQGYKSFLLADLQLAGPERVTVEVLQC